MELRGSTVMITGGAIRVGRQLAIHMAQQGANILFTHLPGEPWEEAQAQIAACGAEVLAQPLDIRDTAQIRAVVARGLARFGQIAVLINSASVWLKAPFLEITEAQWDNALDVNLKGPFFLAQAVAAGMMRQGRGVIINITDISAFQPWAGYAPHGASKSGLVSLTKSLAVELAPTVRVNAIAPGTILLPPNCPPEVEHWLTDKALLKRIGHPTDVARLAQLIIECDYFTGSILQVDGGMALT
ncbi:MAG: SDR family oxidoreductase [Chloroflexi bacterium]|nr:SDR family oxidoreductase [Chloroflexota bacterium]